MSIDRRRFLQTAAASAAAMLLPEEMIAQTAGMNEFITGNGEFRYRMVSGWGKLPAGTAYGGTHGGIAQDKSGRIYVSTQSETGILIYSADGQLEKTIAHEYPEV